MSTEIEPDGLALMSWLSHGRVGHHPSAHCPRCGIDCSTGVGIQQLAYTFERCDCGTPEYTHLVETLWHRECITEHEPEGAVVELLRSIEWHLERRHGSATRERRESLLADVRRMLAEKKPTPS